MMPLYFSKHFDLQHVGDRLVQVHCDKCRCPYFYELARIGSGSATAPYGVGTTSAARSAEKQSQRDLRERLAIEAELVPCPKCNWINEELVQGYRQSRYRRAGLIAIGVGLLGTIGSLISAWFISIGPAADRGALPYCLFGGPALFVSLALILILLRSWVRSRIQPNRNFPLAPTLPVGTPPALVENQSTGELEQATSQDDRFTLASTWHEFQIGRHNLPHVCCGCLKSASLEHAYNHPIAATIELNVPRCAECAHDYRRSYLRIWLIVVAIALLIGGGVALVLRLEVAEFWIFIVTLALISAALASWIASTTTAPVKVGGGDASRAVVKLRFRNPEYGAVVNRQLQHRTDQAVPTQ